MKAMIDIEYFDDMDDTLPVASGVIDLLNKYGFTDNTKVDFSKVPGGSDAFEAFAVEYHIPGQHATHLVAHKYLQLYEALLQKARAEQAPQNKPRESEQVPEQKQVTDVPASSTVTEPRSETPAQETAPVSESSTVPEQEQQVVSSTATSEAKPAPEPDAVSDVDDDLPFDIGDDDTSEPDAQDETEQFDGADVAATDAEKQALFAKLSARESQYDKAETETDDDLPFGIGDDDISESKTGVEVEDEQTPDNIDVTESDADAATNVESVIDATFKSSRAHATFNPELFFEKTPETITFGPVRVNRKLADAGDDHMIAADDLTMQMMRSVMTQTLDSPVAASIMDGVGYKALYESYVMYMTGATGHLKRDDWRVWCIQKALSRVMKNDSSIAKFQKHPTVSSIVNDIDPATKLADPIRWFMLLSSVEPHNADYGSDSHLDKQHDELLQEMRMLGAVESSILAMFVPEDGQFKNALIGKSVKHKRLLLDDLRTDLIAPARTKQRTQASRQRMKRDK